MIYTYLTMTVLARLVSLLKNLNAQLRSSKKKTVKRERQAPKYYYHIVCISIAQSADGVPNSVKMVIFVSWMYL